MQRGLTEYLKENFESARHWAELLGRGHVDSLHDIQPSQGARVRLDGRQVAAYRDRSGQLHLRSAVCSHAGCAVQWNGFEGCWDCPCHGSQFDIDGQVLNGPAAEPLAELDHLPGQETAPAHGPVHGARTGAVHRRRA